MPACATPLSPWVDLEGGGGSMTSKDAEDPMVHKPMIEMMGKTYIGSGSLRDPLAAPLYGDLTGLPSLLIQVGSRETLPRARRSVVGRSSLLAMRVMTTNCIPISAAPDDPTRT